MKNRLAAVALFALAAPGAADAACRTEAKGETRYAVCEFQPAKDDIRLFLDAENGEPYGDFAPLAAALQKDGETLLFAMNAGMYHKDRSPVGLYVENYEEKKKLSTKDGPGNFHLKPNGVFWIEDDGVARVTDTGKFVALISSPVYGGGVAEGDGGGVPPSASLRSAAPPQAEEQRQVAFATQSGPMLVIDGALHPRFLVDATSRKRRNGVGVREDGRVVFAISDTPVTFYEFARYFRDELKTPNALYLDGTISRLYAPELSRNDPGAMMGPIVGVVGKAE